MNLLKRLRNLWKLSGKDPHEFTGFDPVSLDQFNKINSKMATIIKLKDPIDKLLEK